jgi:hypothetical protein
VNYLLDTCVISEVVRKTPSADVVAWLAAQDEDHLFMSVLSLGEVHKGIARLDDARRRSTLEAWVATCGADSAVGSSPWMRESPRAGDGYPAPPSAPGG